MRTIDLDDLSRVIVLGEGQIGTAISRSLVRARPSVGVHSRTDWRTPETASSSIAAALAEIERTTAPRGEGITTVVWSAGTAGMTTSQQRCDHNLETMKAAVSAALDSVPAHRSRRLHIISSAGAHAAGRPRWPATNDVAAAEPPPAEVPYINLKFAEEAWARSVGNSAIHRVASVYARPGDPGRSGMVAALVRNAARGKVTPIYGRWSTARNYVHADDVGEFISQRIRFASDLGGSSRSDADETLLADRRSYAIGELIRLVSTALRKPVPVQMIEADNADNHTFNPSLISSGFSARPLATAIRQMLVDLQRQ